MGSEQNPRPMHLASSDCLWTASPAPDPAWHQQTLSITPSCYVIISAACRGLISGFRCSLKTSVHSHLSFLLSCWAISYTASELVTTVSYDQITRRARHADERS